MLGSDRTCGLCQQLESLTWRWKEGMAGQLTQRLLVYAVLQCCAH